MIINRQYWVLEILMYLCNCNGLTVGDILKVCSDGLRDPNDVFDCFEVEQGCGKCVPEIKQFLLDCKQHTKIHPKISEYQEIGSNNSV